MIRKVAVLVLLVGAMLGVQLLQGSVGEEASKAMTLAVIGFVILAAQQLAEIASAIGFPRVTGYIVAGIAAGPQAGALIAPETVGDMKVFNELALALIALEAGLELRIDSIKRVAKTLGGIVLFKMPLTWLLVGGAFVAASPLLPGADSLEMGAIVGVALMLGALAVGTSPAVSVAVIAESGAKGKTPDLILAIAVAKDVVMIVMLALAMAVADVLVTEGAEMSSDIFVSLGAKIFLSLAAGGVVGAAIIAWMKWVRWELVLLLILAGYGLSAASETLHLKALLVFIAAGFTVANFSEYGHALHKPLALLALPVFVVFFTIVGAGLDLSAAVAVLPLVGILFVARLAMLYISTRLGCRIAGDSPRFANNAWLGMVSQAGVALGLLLIAQDTVPALAEPLGQVASVLIAANLLIGPVLLRQALKYVEDAPEAVGDEAADEGPDPDAVPEEAELRAVHATIGGHIDALVAATDEVLISVWADRATTERPQRSRKAVHLNEAFREVEGAVGELRRNLAELPMSVRVPRRSYHLEVHPGMSWIDRVALVRWRLPGVGPANRSVPVRRAGRTLAEGTMLPGLYEVATAVARAEIADLCRATLAEPPARPAEVAEGLRQRLQRHARLAKAEVGRALRLGGSPALSARRLDYRTVAKDVDRAVRRLADDGRAWDPVLDAVARRAAVAAELDTLGAELREGTRAALESWRTQLDGKVFTHIRYVEDALEEADAGGDDAALVSQRLHAVDTRLRQEILPALATLKSEEVSLSAALGGVAQHVRATLATAPEAVHAAVGRLDPDRIDRPSDVRVADLTPRDAAVQYLSGELVWLDDAREDAERMLDLASQRLSEIAGIISYGVSLAASEVDGGVALARSSVSRARAAADELRKSLVAEEQEILTHVQGSIDDAVAHVLRQAVGDRRGGQAFGSTTLAAATGRAGKRVFDGVVDAGEAVFGVLGRIEDSQRAQDARVARGAIRLDPGTMARALDDLDVSAAQWDRVPRVLARLFDASTLDVAQALVGSEGQVAHLEHAWARFCEGEPTAVLLVGAEGSGKTSVARVTLRRAVGRRLVTVSLDPLCRTESGLSAAIGSALGLFDVSRFSDVERALAGRRRLVLLDGLEQAFVRTSGGLAHLRRLLQLIAATRHSICWVVSVSDPTVRYLEHLCELRSWFTDYVDFPPLDGATLASLVESRCKLSGFEAHYPAPRVLRGGPVTRLRQRLRGRGDQERRRSFYANLATASGGNIRDALALWINAIVRVDDDLVQLRNIHPPSVAWFDQLGHDAHRVAAAIALCGTLSRAEIIGVMRWPFPRVDAAIAALRGARLVQVHGGDDRYRLWPPAWRRVTELLAERRSLIPRGLDE